jgi:stage II sporulation protein AB (anti-sigma F factor)
VTATIALELPAAPESVAEARHAAAALAQRVGADVADVKIAVSEAVGNAVVHAYRGRAEGEIRVQGRVRAGKLRFTITDRGVGMSPNLESPGLRLGIPLIGKVAEDVHIDGDSGGTTISFSFPVAVGG